MRRIVLGAILIAVLALAVALPAGADPRGGVDPACADITAAAANYDTSQHSIGSNVRTAEPTCKNVNYTVWIAYASSDNGLLVQTSQTQRGNGVDISGTGIVVFDLLQGVNAANDKVCVRFTSSRGKGDNIYDWAPDTSAKVTPFLDGSGQIDCNGWGQTTVDSSGAGGGFN
jgi:hypothetical protein